MSYIDETTGRYNTAAIMREAHRLAALDLTGVKPNMTHAFWFSGALKYVWLLARQEREGWEMQQCTAIGEVVRAKYAAYVGALS